MIKCAKCNAPHDRYLTRNRQTGEWSSSLNLAGAQPLVWERPRKIVITPQEFCQHCEEAKKC